MNKNQIRKSNESQIMREGYPRTGFVFYSSFYESLDSIESKDRWTIIDSIIRYGLYGDEPKLDGLHKIVFTLIKPQIDANHAKFLNGKKGVEHGIKGAEHGKKGGRPNLNNPPQTDQEPAINPRKEKEKVNVNVNKSVFVPPSICDVEAYFIENGYSSELADRAFKGYDVAGWTDTKGKPVINWKQKCHHVWFKPENKHTVNASVNNEPAYLPLSR